MSYSVLIVEDDPMVLMINSQFVCKNTDFIVAGTCRNGKEAIDFLQENKVDLILLDVYMPVMNGTETLKKIRKMQINTDVIMVTAANDNTTIEETMHLGVMDYLVKPFTFERFNVSLEKFAQKNRILKENSVMDQSCIDSLISTSIAQKEGKEGKEGQESVKQNNIVVKEKTSESVSIPENLPKGIQQKTLSLIQNYFKTNTSWVGVDSISEVLGVSIVTVRNYLNYLVKIKYIKESVNYETGGRPSMLYKVR